MSRPSPLSLAKKEITDFLAAQLPGEISPAPDDIERPPQPQLGDLAYGCFEAAKILKKPPAAVAKELAAAMRPVHFVLSAEAAGPYVNFRFDRGVFARAQIEEILGDPENFGRVESAEEKIVVEYVSPNTHKELHVGHLRNIFLGIAVTRLLSAAGKNVIPVTYIGDVGAHVAKCLWAFKKFHSQDEIPANKGRYLGGIYSDAVRRIDEHPEYKEEAAAVQRALEAKDPEWTALWEKTRQWSLDQFQAIFRELGVYFERTYFESEVEEDGKRMAQELLDRGIAERSRGAVIVNLENDRLGVFLILKSDGTALYATKELALAKKKFAEYAPDQSIHIVDARQSLYFKQFFKTLERMGFSGKLIHLAYEFVTLEEGAMSSRAGNVVAYEDFRDEMIKGAAAETAKRHGDWPEAKVREGSWMIAEGAMKFGMLKQDIDRPIVFDLAGALSFDGFTGPYVQYAHARLCSILDKAGATGGEAALQAVSFGEFLDAEYGLVRMMAEFPSMVRSAAAARKPSLLAQYLFETAQAVSDFYRDVPVLAAEAGDQARRLVIVRAARIALERGLHLLGIRAPEEM